MLRVPGPGKLTTVVTVLSTMSRLVASRMEELLLRLEEMEADGVVEAKARALLQRIGFRADMLEQPLSSLSGTSQLCQTLCLLAEHAACVNGGSG